MVRFILSLALLACLLAPGARAQATADQLNKLSLEALTAPPPPGAGGGWASTRRSYARPSYTPHYSYARPTYARRSFAHYAPRHSYTRHVYAARRSYSRHVYARSTWHPHRSYASAWGHRSTTSPRWNRGYSLAAAHWSRPVAQRHFVAHWTRAPQVHHVAAHRMSRYTPKFYRHR